VQSNNLVQENIYKGDIVFLCFPTLLIPDFPWRSYSGPDLCVYLCSWKSRWISL